MNSNYSPIRRNISIHLLRALVLPLVIIYLFSNSITVQAASLTVTPLTWNVIGLDSNNVNAGPNTFPVGARACNNTGATVTNVTATLNWTSTNAFIDTVPGSANPLTVSSLANLECTDFYFNIQVTRTASAYNTTRAFNISVTGTGLTA